MQMNTERCVTFAPVMFVFILDKEKDRGRR